MVMMMMMMMLTMLMPTVGPLRLRGSFFLPTVASFF